MPRTASRPIRILHHHDADGWWTESPDVDGWSAAGDTYAEAVKLAEEGVPFALGHDAELEHYVQQASASRHGPSLPTMRTPADEAALSAFIDAATSDADPGYPHGTAFIPWQETPHTDRILWRYLHEGRPAVIVGTSDFDMLIEPIQLGRFARLRNEVLQRITVEVSYRRKEVPPSAGESITVTRRGIVAQIVSTNVPPHLAAMVADGSVRPGTGSRHLPMPVKPRDAGKTAAEYISEGRR